MGGLAQFVGDGALEMDVDQAAGHTVLAIEHDLDLIAAADMVIDLGPEGGDGGGRIVAQGTPEEIAACESSWTGKALRAKLGMGSDTGI